MLLRSLYDEKKKIWGGEIGKLATLCIIVLQGDTDSMWEDV